MRPFALSGFLGAAIGLGGCGDAPPQAAQSRTPIADTVPSLAPAITAPMEVPDGDDPPSYEVGIATAASERNDAKEKCAEIPESERVACEAEADAAFESAQSELEDLRGNQQ